MQDRFKFRAGITLDYDKDNGDEAEVQIILYNISVDSGGGAINVHQTFIMDALSDKGLSENEQDSAIDNLYGSCCCDNEYYYIDSVDFVEQCTGLKDKNGKLIYEGDIIEVENNKCKITWESENARYNVEGYGEIAYLNYNEIEVIGNIHENPELLEKE